MQREKTDVRDVPQPECGWNASGHVWTRPNTCALGDVHFGLMLLVFSLFEPWLKLRDQLAHSASARSCRVGELPLLSTMETAYLLNLVNSAEDRLREDNELSWYITPNMWVLCADAIDGRDSPRPHVLSIQPSELFATTARRSREERQFRNRHVLSTNPNTIHHFIRVFCLTDAWGSGDACSIVPFMVAQWSMATRCSRTIELFFRMVYAELTTSPDTGHSASFGLAFILVTSTTFGVGALLTPSTLII